MRFLRKHYLIILILIVALFLRLYNVGSTMTFLEDEGRDLLIMHRMIDQSRPVMLGPQTSTGNMYLGPLYYYLVTPALILSGMDPLGPVIFIALLGVLKVYLLYRFTFSWFGQRSAVITALLYAVSPLPVVFARNSWNPNLAPLFALLITWVVVNLIEKKAYGFKNFFLLGIFFGALIQMHYMTLLFLVGVGLTLLIYLRKSLPALLKGAFIALLGLAMSLAPFIVFELRNDFVNTRAITRFVEAKEEHNIRYSLPLQLWSDKVGTSATRLFASLFGRDSLTPDPARLIITYTITILIISSFYSALSNRNQATRAYKIIFCLFIIPLLFIGIYQENVHLHYLGFFFPLIYLLVGTSLRCQAHVRWLSGSVVLLLLLYSTPQLISYLGSNNTNQVQRAKEVAQYIVKSAGDSPYNVVSAYGTHTTPFLYFTNISGHPPTTTPVKTLFLICQGEPCTADDVSTPFIFLTGPAHPTIEAYLGHPLIHYFEGERELLSNDHISNGAWVARINVKIDP